MSNVGNAIAYARRGLREEYGSTLIWNGTAYACRRKPIPVSDIGDIAAGVGLGNQANPDWWLVTLSPADFGGGYPQENDTVVWDDGFAEDTYVIAKADAPTIAGATPSILIVCYRQPAAPSATVEASGESGAGLRPVFNPEPNPIQLE